MGAVDDLFARLARAGAPVVESLPAAVAAVVGTPEATAIVVPWEDPLEVASARRRELEGDAKTEMAQARVEHARMLTAGRRVAAKALLQILELLDDPTWLKEQGPIGISAITKLMDSVNKEHRLNNGQATENIAHAITTLDPDRLSKMTPEERAVLRKGLLRASEETEK